MGIVEWVTAVVLIIGIGMAGMTKLTGQKMAVDTAERLGYTGLMRQIGIAEILGAIGVLIGAISSGLEWLGVLAGLGIVATMVGALVYHRRAKDPVGQMAPAAVLGIVAVLYIVALFAN